MIKLTGSVFMSSNIGCLSITIKIHQLIIIKIIEKHYKKEAHERYQSISKKEKEENRQYSRGRSKKSTRR